MSPVGFEPTISVGERPKAYALDRAATGTGNIPQVRYENTNTLKLLIISQYVLGERACQISVLCENTRRKLNRNLIISFASPLGVYMALPL